MELADFDLERNIIDRGETAEVFSQMATDRITSVIARLGCDRTGVAPSAQRDIDKTADAVRKE